ncbi:14153_t:CDS:1, partial [Acaulospora morrowiae]
KHITSLFQPIVTKSRSVNQVTASDDIRRRGQGSRNPTKTFILVIPQSGMKS